MSGQAPPGGGSGAGSGRDDDPFAVRPATDADRERPARPLAPIGWGRSEEPVPAPVPAPEDDILAGIVPLDPADDEERVAPLDQADLDADDRDPDDLSEPAPEPEIADAPVDAGEVGFPGEPDPGYVPTPSADADPAEVLTGEVLPGEEPAPSEEAPAELVLEPVDEGDRTPSEHDGSSDEDSFDVDSFDEGSVVDAQIVEDAPTTVDPEDVADTDDTVLLTPLDDEDPLAEDDGVVDDPAVADDDLADYDDDDDEDDAPAPAALAPAAAAARAAAMAWAAGSAAEAPAAPAVAAPPAATPPAYVPPTASAAAPPSGPGPEERPAAAIELEDADADAAWSVPGETAEQGPPAAPEPQHDDPRIDDEAAPLARDAPETEQADATPAAGTAEDRDADADADDEPVDAIALLFGDAAEPDEPAEHDEPADPEEDRTRVLPAVGAGAGAAAAAGAAASASSPRADRDAPTVATPTPTTPAGASSPGAPSAGRVPPPYAPPSAPAPYATAARTPTPPPAAPASPPRPRDPRGPRRTAFWVGGALLLVLLLIGLFYLGQRLGSGATSEAEPTPSASAEATPTPTPTPTDPVQGPAAAGVQAWDALLGGECIDPYTTPWEEEFTVVDCAVEHPAQMVARVALPQTDDAYPGVDAVRESADGLCIADTVIDYAAARAYDDVQYQSAYPITEEEWAAGDRDAYCFVSRAGGGAFTSSIGVPQPPVVP